MFFVFAEDEIQYFSWMAIRPKFLPREVIIVLESVYESVGCLSISVRWLEEGTVELGIQVWFTGVRFCHVASVRAVRRMCLALNVSAFYLHLSQVVTDVSFVFQVLCLLLLFGRVNWRHGIRCFVLITRCRTGLYEKF